MGPQLIFILILAVSCLLVSGREVAIEFGGKPNCDEFAKLFGVSYAGTVGLLDHIHIFRSNESTTPLKRANAFQGLMDFLDGNSQLKRNLNSEVKWYQEQIPKPREKRVIAILDPLYQDQWHLHGSPRTHLNVEAAWNEGFMGEGIRIAIVDDGIQTTHPDVKNNVRVESSWNFNKGIQSPDPTYLKGPSGDWHGTASAGAAAARNDGVYCGVGVAPHAELAGIAILQNNAEVGDSVEAQALSFMPQHNHIYSNSWGPIKPGSGNHANEKPGPLLQQALEKTISTGRGGLGSIYVWAAGNDGSSQDNCNYDGYASMRYAILIGSTDHQGNPSSYSEPCSAMLAVAPGGLVSSNKIVTTDLLGGDGLDPRSDCTSYSGTSASCPLGAGIMALALQVNPNVTWLELQYIIIEATSKHNDDGTWTKNAAGFWHSNRLGFGLLDAYQVIKTAARWKEQKIHVNEVTFSFNASEGKHTIDVPDTAILHHVEIDLWSPAAVFDSTIEIQSPSGTRSTLATPHDDRLSQWNGWTFLSRSFHGEVSKGTWTLNIQSKGQKAFISKWNIRFYGRENITNTAQKTSGDPLTKPAEVDDPNEYLLFVFLPFILLVALLIRKMTTTRMSSSPNPGQGTLSGVTVDTTEKDSQ